MKTKTFLWRAVHMCMVAMMACVINVSCSKEEPIVPEPTPTPTPSSDNGEVSFEISNDSGTGTGTSTSPAEVSKGDTLNMVISQKSKYTDSDGTVFECEPKATIELFAHLDTVYVEDLSQLTNVQETPETQTEAEGKDPVVNKINQKFLIGEQYVNFDLAYEVYDYTTVGGETIEMPYIKLNQANFGNSGATEEAEPNARSETVVKSITVKPLPQTRASISDTTWYEVNAIFNLDIESVNTKSENKQNLTFSVTYLGAVTTEIELSDPVKELSSTLDILGGTSSVASPFLVNPKETLSLLFKQNSSYTDAYGNKMSCEPEARINLFAQQDTVYALTKDEIAKAPSTKDVAFTASGESPILYSAIQSIYAGNQNIQLEMSYETFSATDVENQEIEMPYLKFENVSVGELSINESKTRSVVEADTAFYDVQVPIKLDVVNVGTEDENRQTLEFVVSYVGAVVTEIALSDPIKELSSTIKVLGGTSSTSSPFLAEPGDTLNLLFEQNSSYTDAHGRKISCSPVARLTLFAQQNTIYVQTKDELEGTPTNQELVFKSSGKEPTQYSATQLFKLGAQAMQLELSYEAYTQKDAEDNEIEMPYLKFENVSVGELSINESKTRSVVEADTAFYDVQVPIKLDVVNVGTEDENRQTLEFVVSYVGAVVTEIALSDPIKELSSTIKVLGGTSSTSSPFLAEPGDTLNLLFEQNSSYTDAHGRKISCSPVARLTLFAQQNTIYVQTKDELEGTPTNQELVFKSSGKEPTQYSATQLFKLGAQAMQLELSYEAYTQKDAEDNEIEMPYLKFNSTTASSVSVSEISTSTGTKADTTFYKVQVPIKLETVNVGTAQEDKKVIEIIASYKGAVVTLKDEPELVKVEYRKGYVWEEAHHNLPLLYYAKVYRDRYYSNGEVFTDEFVDNGHPMELTPALVCIGYNDDAFLAEGEYQYSEDDIVIFHKGTMNGEANDSIRTTTSIVEVDDLNAITVKEEFHPSPDGDGYPGKWSCYVTGKTYDDGVYMPVDPGLATSSYESCDLPSGWYFQGFTEKADVTQVFYKDYIASIYSMFMHIRCYDQYLAIDGIRINFLDYLPERVFNTVVENTSYGKKITRETRVKFLGRNFYAACIMEFHQKQ